MKINFTALPLAFIGLLFTFLGNCSCSSVQTHPKYKGIDPKVQDIVNEYKDLAKNQGITFKHDVSIGFKNIDDGNVIGECITTPTFREINLDIEYWENSNYTSHLALLEHELNHCYCDRDHDYHGKPYPDPSELRGNGKSTDPNKEGYYPDGCPQSIMFPIILDNDCMTAHYGDYAVELFDRCDPY